MNRFTFILSLALLVSTASYGQLNMAVLNLSEYTAKDPEKAVKDSLLQVYSDSLGKVLLQIPEFAELQRKASELYRNSASAATEMAQTRMQLNQFYGQRDQMVEQMRMAMVFDRDLQLAIDSIIKADDLAAVLISNSSDQILGTVHSTPAFAAAIED